MKDRREGQARGRGAAGRGVRHNGQRHGIGAAVSETLTCGGAAVSDVRGRCQTQRTETRYRRGGVRHRRRGAAWAWCQTPRMRHGRLIGRCLTRRRGGGVRHEGRTAAVSDVLRCEGSRVGVRHESRAAAWCQRR
ncbi:MAG: hypothetical protein LBK25_09650 [Treponema sp.]|nr:hypothetical protein [Treponema sp.]